MSKQPLISVIMPAYNSGRYILEAIKSILSQTYQNFELIIYDDGSTDDTRKVINQFSDARIIKIFSDCNLGVVAARNRMLEIAQGEYIALMDSDDIAHKERLERQLFAIWQTNLDICGSAQFVLNQKTGKIRKSHDRRKDADLRSLMVVYCPICNSTVMGKADIFKKMRYDISLLTSEDYYLWARIAAAGYVFGNIKERLVTYRMYPEQATASHPMEFRESTMLVQIRYLEMLGLSTELRPRPLRFLSRLKAGMHLLSSLKKRFPGISFGVGCEIYARFQRKGGIINSFVMRIERWMAVIILFMFVQ